MTEGRPDLQGGLTDDQRVGHYIELWKHTVNVQLHFNELEWRIRGLALTAATFALGAAGVAARDGTEIWNISLGAIVLFVALFLWSAFYFVDRAWYHPLLRAAGDNAVALEQIIQDSGLPHPGLTVSITAASPYRPTRMVRLLSRTPGQDMRSGDKLRWFYTLGGSSIALFAVVLLVAGFAN